MDVALSDNVGGLAIPRTRCSEPSGADTQRALLRRARWSQRALFRRCRWVFCASPRRGASPAS